MIQVSYGTKQIEVRMPGREPYVIREYEEAYYFAIAVCNAVSSAFKKNGNENTE